MLHFYISYTFVINYTSRVHVQSHIQFLVMSNCICTYIQHLEVRVKVNISCFNLRVVIDQRTLSLICNGIVSIIMIRVVIVPS